MNRLSTNSVMNWSYQNVDQAFVSLMESRLDNSSKREHSHSTSWDGWSDWKPDAMDLFESILRNVHEAARCVQVGEKEQAARHFADLANYAMKGADRFGFYV